MIRDILDVATPSMRPPWSGRTRPLTHDEVVVLRLAIQLEGEVQWKAVYALLGERKATAALTKLKKSGGIIHPRYGRYEITEKGRIAAALHAARRTKP